jgi:hypothetical protein
VEPVPSGAETHVHIESLDPSKTPMLYRVEWETHDVRYTHSVRAVSGGPREGADTSDQVTNADSTVARAICDAPCDQDVPRGWGTRFFLGGEGITPSSHFTLDPQAPRLTIKVSPGSLVRTRLGTAALITAAACLFVSVLTLPAGGVGHNDGALIAGGTLLTTGSLLVGAGVPLLITGKTKYSIDGQGPVIHF